MIGKTLRVLFLLLALASSLQAADAESGGLNATDGSNPLVQYGVGATYSCGAFLAATYGLAPASYMTLQQGGRTYSDSSHAMMQWALGFITGINTVRAFEPPPRPVQIETDEAAISVWVANWCSANPTASLGTAVARFVLDGAAR